jgi:hypothetical protein
LDLLPTGRAEAQADQNGNHREEFLHTQWPDPAGRVGRLELEVSIE